MIGPVVSARFDRVLRAALVAGVAAWAVLLAAAVAVGV